MGNTPPAILAGPKPFASPNVGSYTVIDSYAFLLGPIAQLQQLIHVHST